MADPTANPHWCRSILDRLMAILLAVELLRWLQWFPYNHDQGWTALIAMASVEVASLLLLRFVVALSRLRIPFNLSTLAVLAVAFACIWLPGKWQKAERQRETVAIIQRAGGRVLYDYQLDENGNEIEAATPPGLPWLREICGEDYFRSIAAVELPQADDVALECVGELRRLRKLSLSGGQITDVTLEHFKGFTKLCRLHLQNTSITDKGLEYLRGMTDLQDLDLSNTHVTNDGIKHLKLLARLRIVQLGGTKVTGDGAVELRLAVPGCMTGGAEAHELQGREFLLAARAERRKHLDQDASILPEHGTYNKTYDKAVAEFNEALKFDPDYELAYTHRGEPGTTRRITTKLLPISIDAYSFSPTIPLPISIVVMLRVGSRIMAGP